MGASIAGPPHRPPADLSARAAASRTGVRTAGAIAVHRRGRRPATTSRWSTDRWRPSPTWARRTGATRTPWGCAGSRETPGVSLWWCATASRSARIPTWCPRLPWTRRCRCFGTRWRPGATSVPPWSRPPRPPSEPPRPCRTTPSSTSGRGPAPSWPPSCGDRMAAFGSVGDSRAYWVDAHGCRADRSRRLAGGRTDRLGPLHHVAGHASRRRAHPHQMAGGRLHRRRPQRDRGPAAGARPRRAGVRRAVELRPHPRGDGHADRPGRGRGRRSPWRAASRASPTPRGEPTTSPSPWVPTASTDRRGGDRAERGPRAQSALRHEVAIRSLVRPKGAP